MDDRLNGTQFRPISCRSVEPQGVGAPRGNTFPTSPPNRRPAGQKGTGWFYTRLHANQRIWLNSVSSVSGQTVQQTGGHLNSIQPYREQTGF